jgi:hypothetical protein
MTADRYIADGRQASSPSRKSNHRPVGWHVGSNITHKLKVIG